jgi:hypothetical protein
MSQGGAKLGGEEEISVFVFPFDREKFCEVRHRTEKAVETYIFHLHIKRSSLFPVKNTSPTPEKKPAQSI